METIHHILQRLERRASKAEITTMAQSLRGMDGDAVQVLLDDLHSNGKNVLYKTWLLENTLIPYDDRFRSLSGQLVVLFKECPVDGVRRMTGKILNSGYLFEENHDDLYVHCLHLIGDSNETVAVKYHAILMAGTIASVYPDLLIELRALIENELEKNSIAFRKAYEKMEKIIKRKRKISK